MRITLLCIGKTNDKTLQDMILEYQKRIPKYYHFEKAELSDLKNAKNLSAERIKSEEGKLILQNINEQDYLILLDERGVEYTSIAFSEKLKTWTDSSKKRLVFAIGGAYGFSDEIKTRADEKISLSKMTFNHQMIRLFFTEQFYRATSIIDGKPYHNE